MLLVGFIIRILLYMLILLHKILENKDSALNTTEYYPIVM